jgi:cytochrome c-type biogenesis protein CcmF
MLLGILLSSAQKEVLSKNNGILLPFEPATKENPTENITLIKGLKTNMGRYWATYEKSDSSIRNGTVSFFKINFEDKNTHEKFSLYPNLIKNTKGQQGFSNNPDARHYWNKDIFTYISYASTMDGEEDTIQFRKHTVKLKDTVYYANGLMVLDTVAINPPNTKHTIGAADTAIVATLKVRAKDSSIFYNLPFFGKEPTLHWFLIQPSRKTLP